VSKQPFILTNTDHLLQILSEQNISPNAYLFTLDVSSLYTNIPIGDGIEAVKHFFQKYPCPDRPDSHLITLLSISLFKNDFLFNGQMYRQKKGVAMGKQYAPTFANLYMSLWEEKILNLPGPKPALWLRYIDDIFGIWDGSLADFHKFIESTNLLNQDIQVTSNSSLSDVQFLDVVIFKNGSQKLSTMVYLKSTSSLRLIHPRSLHPKHTKSGVIFSQILRFIRNCSFKNDFLYQLNFLFSSLRNQGNSHSFLRSARLRAY
jgi:hypothetical protein